MNLSDEHLVRRKPLELQGQSDVSTTVFCNVRVNITPSLSYDSAELAAARTHAIALTGAGGFWDVDDWDEFFWDGTGQPKAQIKPDGSGTNIGFTVAGESTYENPHTIYGATVDFSARRLER